MKKKILIGLSLFVLLYSCRREPDILFDDTWDVEVPDGFPEPVFPADNQLTKNRVALGKKLFFDPRFSSDNSISCASCHFQQYAFADNRTVSTGVQNRSGTRNAPALFNLAWQNSFMRDGGVPTLELQVLAPIADHNEMDFNIVLVAERLKNDAYYNKMAVKAYGRELDPFVITRAIAAYERTLVSGNSAYDRFLYAGGTLTVSELRGKDLFFSDSLHCGDCHSGFNFTNQAFENNGLYTTYSDTGRARITMRPEDSGKFRVPSLRNIEYTAPYMHNGSFATLEDVIAHYKSGGAGHTNQNPMIAGFSLTLQDETDLINFLKSLSDVEFITNPKHAP